MQHALVEDSIKQRAQMQCRKLRLLTDNRVFEVTHQRAGLVDVVVGYADMEDLAAADQVFQRARRLLGMSQQIRAMHLIEIELLHLQSPQGVLAGRFEVRRVVGQTGNDAALGRQHHPLAQSG